MIPVEFHPLAEAEFIKQARYYDDRVPGLGEAFISELEAVTAMLESYPDIGAALDADLRSLTLRRFPHSVIYATEADRLWILAVAHQRRKPGYWRQRTG